MIRDGEVGALDGAIIANLGSLSLDTLRKFGILNDAMGKLGLLGKLGTQTFVFKERESNHSPPLSLIFS